MTGTLKMSTEAERLMRAEVEISHLKESFDDVKKALIQLAEDMHTLAVSDAARQEDRRTFERIFMEQNAVKDEMVRLWQRTDDIISAREVAAKERLEAEIRRQSAENKKRGAWIWDIAKMLAASSLAFLAAHLVWH